MSDSERSRGTCRSCRCVRPAIRLRSPGTSGNLHRNRIEPRSSPRHGVAGPCRRTGRRAAGFRNAGRARNDTRCGHPARSRPAIAHRTRRRREPRVPLRGLSRSRRRGLCVARSQRTTVGHSRQGSSGYVGPASSPHTSRAAPLRSGTPPPPAKPATGPGRRRSLTGTPCARCRHSAGRRGRPPAPSRRGWS